MPKTNSSDLAALGRFIHEQRTQAGLTQTQLAERIGWVQERISILENGKYGLPSLPLLAQIADALQCPLAAVLAAVGYPTTDTTRASGEQVNGATVDALFYAIDRLLSIDTVQMNEALDQASTIISDMMGADKVDIFLYDPSIASLVAVGASDTPMGRHQRAIGMDRLPIANGGRSVEVFLSGKTYGTGHADEDPGELAGVTGGLKARSIVNVPLITGESTRGVFSVLSAEPERFSEYDRRFIETVTRWISVIVRRGETEGSSWSRTLDSDQVASSQPEPSLDSHSH